MIDYSSREEAENDPGLNLRIIYKCNICGQEREEYPQYLVDKCGCGGDYDRIAETYDAI